MNDLEPLFYITLFELTLKKEDPAAYEEVRGRLEPDCGYLSLDPQAKQAWAESAAGGEYRRLLGDAVQARREDEEAAERGLKLTLECGPRERLSGLAERARTSV